MRFFAARRVRLVRVEDGGVAAAAFAAAVAATVLLVLLLLLLLLLLLASTLIAATLELADGELTADDCAVLRGGLATMLMLVFANGTVTLVTTVGLDMLVMLLPVMLLPPAGAAAKEPSLAPLPLPMPLKLLVMVVLKEPEMLGLCPTGKPL